MSTVLNERIRDKVNLAVRIIEKCYIYLSEEFTLFGYSLHKTPVRWVFRGKVFLFFNWRPMKFKIFMILSIISSTIFAPSASAEISPRIAVICQPHSEKYFAWSFVNREWKTTHARIFENWTTEPTVITKTLEVKRVLAANVTTTSGAEVNAGNAIGSLSAHLNVSLADYESTTKTTTVQQTVTVSRQTMYVFYRGNKMNTGYFTLKTCNSNGSGFVSGSSGSAKSFEVVRDGLLDCDVTPGTNSLGFSVKNEYC
jgi:hypothetical protein